MQEQRFRTEVAQVMDKLRLAQNLMLILNEDVKVHFKRQANGISCGLSFRCPLSGKGWGKEINREQLLTAINLITFKGIGKETNNKGDFALEFLSGGMVMSEGILKLSTAKGRLYSDQRFVCLPGYPSTLISVSKKPDLSCSLTNDRLTQLVVPEILAKFRPTSASGNTETETPGNP